MVGADAIWWGFWVRSIPRLSQVQKALRASTASAPRSTTWWTDAPDVDSMVAGESDGERVDEQQQQELDLLDRL